MADETKKPDLITASNLALLCGVTPDAVRKFIRREKVETDRLHRVSLSDPAVIQYMTEKSAERRVPGFKPKGARTDVIIRKDDPRRRGGSVEKPKRPAGRPKKQQSVQDMLTEEERWQYNINRRKTEADIRKIEAMAQEKEIKNEILRGGLGDIKFLESVFYQQVHYMVRQFLALPNNTMDGIIARVMEDGKEARTDCINLQNEIINQIGEAAKEGWTAYLKRIESELLKLRLEPDDDSE